MIYFAITEISAVTDYDVSMLRKRVEKHFFDKTGLKRKDSVCAKAVLCNLLKEQYGMSDFLVSYKESGKPYIRNSEVHFNLSHSDDIVLCAVGDERVGCDAEHIKEYNEKIARRFFTEKEQMRLDKSRNKASDFTKLWTLKESILKYSGEGMSGGLSTYDFSGYLEAESFDLYGCHFESRVFSDFAISICCEKKEIFQLEADIMDIIKNEN